MNEEQARQQILAILQRLQTLDSVDEVTLEPDDPAVDYHTDIIKRLSHSGWNETIADNYIRTLPQEVQEEIEDITSIVLDKRTADATY